MPVWLLLVVMSLCTYRLTRIVTRDDFPPVLWVRDRLAGGWRPLTTDEREHQGDLGHIQLINGVDQRYIRRHKWSPPWLGDLVSCPWCASGWLSLGITIGVASTIGVPAPALVWPAIWAVSALIASKEWA